VAIGGGVESVSLTQNDHTNLFRRQDPYLAEQLPQIYMTMLETAEIVAERYGVTRDDQDAYALQSQHRTARAQREGHFGAEIAPVAAQKIVVDRATGESREEAIAVAQDECNRPDTTLA